MNNPLPASESRFCFARKKQLEDLPENSREDLSQYYICRSCGMKFDSFGDMQRRILLEHMRKGELYQMMNQKNENKSMMAL
jgi:Mg/Co/Ni transporter MgtE